jgi:hypothetical protein
MRLRAETPVRDAVEAIKLTVALPTISADIVWQGEARPTTARDVEGGRLPTC